MRLTACSVPELEKNAKIERIEKGKTRHNCQICSVHVYHMLFHSSKNCLLYFKESIMCDEKLKHLLDVRTTIIICFEFPIYFNTNMYENIHKILEEFYIPGPNNNNYLNIQNLEQNISYFGNIPLWHFVQFLMDHKVTSHPIAFQRINAFTSQFEYYYYLAMLWHYGEDWKFISLQLYAQLPQSCFGFFEVVF